MAETHAGSRRDGSRIKRNVSKMAFRSKEKVLRTIGIADETKDEILDHYVVLINKQQIQMHKLQRELKQYINSIKAMGQAHNSFFQSLYDVYENEWTGKDAIATLSQRTKELHEDLCNQLTNELSGELQQHLTQYKDAKITVDKRGRKLVDYDVARRTLHSLKNAKKPDAYKIDKAQEHTNLAKELYDLLNNQLHDQLPTLYDSRLPVTCTTYKNICEAEQKFFTEIVDIRLKLQSILENANTAFEHGEYHIQRMKPIVVTAASTLPAGRSAQIEPKPAATSATASREPSTRVNGVNEEKDLSSHDYINLQVNTDPDHKEEDAHEQPQDYAMAVDYEPPKPVARTKPHHHKHTNHHNQPEPPVSHKPKPVPRTVIYGSRKEDSHLPREDTAEHAGEVQHRTNKQHNEGSSKRKSLLVMLGLKKAEPDHSSAPEEPPVKRTAPGKVEVTDIIEENEKQEEIKLTEEEGSNAEKKMAVASENTAIASEKVQQPHVEEARKADASIQEHDYETVGAIEQQNPQFRASFDEKTEEDTERKDAVIATSQVVVAIEHEGYAEEDSFESTNDENDITDSPIKIAILENSQMDEKMNDISVSSTGNENRDIKMSLDVVRDQTKQHNVGEDMTPVGDYAVVANVEHINAVADHMEDKVIDDNKAIPDDEDDRVSRSAPTAVVVLTDSDNVSVESQEFIKESSHIDTKATDVADKQTSNAYENVVAANEDKSVTLESQKLDVTQLGAYEMVTPHLQNEVDVKQQPDVVPVVEKSSHDPETHYQNMISDLNSVDAKIERLKSEKRTGDDVPVVAVTKERKIEVYKEVDDEVVEAVATSGKKLLKVYLNDADDISLSVKEPCSDVDDVDDISIENKPAADHQFIISDDTLFSPSVRQEECAQNDPWFPTNDNTSSPATEEQNKVEQSLVDSQVPDKSQSQLHGDIHQHNMIESAAVKVDVVKEVIKKEEDKPVEVLQEEMEKAPDRSEAIASPVHAKQLSESSGVSAKQEKDETEKPPADQPIYEVPPDDIKNKIDEKIVSNEENESKSPESAKYLDLPPNYVHSVQAIYKYDGADEDELTFNKGEIIHVVQFPIPDEQDEGWEMGIKQTDWESTLTLEEHMGVFPENFTKQIQL